MSKKTWLSVILFMLSVGLLVNTSWATSEMDGGTEVGTNAIELYCVEDPVTKKIKPDTMRYTYDNRGYLVIMSCGTRAKSDAGFRYRTVGATFHRKLSPVAADNAAVKTAANTTGVWHNGCRI